VLVWLSFIFAMSAQSHPPMVPGGDGLPYVLRKLGHFTEFGILAGLLHRALQPRPSWQAFVLASLYAASDEWHQSFVPGRDMIFTDWVIDSAGAAFAVWIIGLFGQRVRQK
jgi:VanZ family protein